MSTLSQYKSLQELAALSSLDVSNRMMVILDPSSGVNQGTTETTGSVDLPAFQTYLLGDTNTRLTALEAKPGNGAFASPVTMTLTGVITGSVAFDGSTDFSVSTAMGANAIGISSVTNLASSLQSLQDQLDAGPTTYALASTTFSAGNGLSGGGTLASNRSFSLGVPSSVGNGSANAVTATSHTHAISLAASDIPALPASILTSGTLASTRAWALTGDVTSTAGTAVTTLANGVVSLAKMANLATGSLIGRSSAGIGVPEVITIGTGLTLAGGILSNNGGTVTTVSVVNANGISGTVANAGTTPAITLALGAITPSNIAVAGAFTGAARNVIRLANTDTSTTSTVAITMAAGSGAGCNISYSAPEYTVLSGWADALSIENMGTGGFNLSAYGGGGINLYTGTGRTLRWAVDANGNMTAVGGSFSANVALQSPNASFSAPWVQVVGGRTDSNSSQAFSGTILLANNYTAGLAPTGQHLGTLAFGAPITTNNLTTLRTAASISAYADGAWSSTVTPTGIRIYVGSAPKAVGTANTTYGEIKAVEINSSANITLAGNLTVSGGSLFLAGDGSRALTSDGSKNLAFNFPILYNNAGFSLGVNGNYWGFGTDGSLTAGGVVKASGELQSTSPNALRMVSGNYGVFWRQDGANLYLMKTASGSQYGTWDSSRPLVMNLVSGSISSDSAWAFTNSITATSIAASGAVTGSNLSGTNTGDQDLSGYLFLSGSQSITGQPKFYYAPPTGSFATATGNLGAFWIYNATNPAGASFMAFHRAGAYATYFGLDTDNKLKVGGWSMGAVAYSIHHDGLASPVLTTPVINGTVTGTGVSQSVVGSTLVQRNSSGYIFTNYLNTTANDIGTGTPSAVAVQTSGDGYLRWQTPANFIAEFGIVTNGAAASFQRAYAGYDSGVANSFSCNGWFRAGGQTGLYCADYAGGVYMTDTTYLRSYNNKAMVASDFVISSDERLKTGVRPLEYKGRLRPVLYTMIETGHNELGFLAQEVRKLYPETVGVLPETGYLQLSYNRLTAVLSAQVNLLEDDHHLTKIQTAAHTAKIARLMDEVAALRSQVNALKAA